MKICKNNIFFKILFIVSVAIVFTTKFNGVSISNTVRYIPCILWIFVLILSLVKNNTKINGNLIFKNLYWTMLPYVFITLWTLFIWILNPYGQEIGIRNYTRLISSILWLFLYLAFASSGFYFFKRNTLNLIFIGACISYTCSAIIPYILSGNNIFIPLLNYILLKDYNATTLEVHDATFAFGLFIIYFLCFGKNVKHRKLKLGLSYIFFILGYKRIGIIAIILAIVYYLLIKRIKNIKLTCFISTLFMILVSFGFVYSIKSGIFASIVEQQSIETSGRLGFYEFAANYYETNLSFLGHGFTWFSRYWGTLYYSGFRINGYGVAASIHSDLLTYFIEFGTVLFLFYIVYYFYIRVIKMKNAFNRCVALSYMVSLVYTFFLYFTDNCSSYGCVQILFFAIPVAIGMESIKKKQKAYQEVLVNKEFKMVNKNCISV